MHGKSKVQPGIRLQPLYCPPAMLQAAAAHLMLLALVTQRVFHLGSLPRSPLALLLHLRGAEREFCTAGISKGACSTYCSCMPALTLRTKQH